MEFGDVVFVRATALSRRLFNRNGAGRATVGAPAAARAIVADRRFVVYNFDASAGASIDARAATDAGIFINDSSHLCLLKAFVTRATNWSTSRENRRPRKTRRELNVS